MQIVYAVTPNSVSPNSSCLLGFFLRAFDLDARELLSEDVAGQIVSTLLSLVHKFWRTSLKKNKQERLTYLA